MNDSLLSQGNRALRRQDYALALRYYQAAIELQPALAPLIHANRDHQAVAQNDGSLQRVSVSPLWAST